ATPAHAQALREDPVEQLRQALKVEPNRHAEVLEHAAKITNIGDLARALALREWPFKSTTIRPPGETDPRLGDRLADRFVAGMQLALTSKSTLRQLAAAGLLGELQPDTQISGVEISAVEEKLASLGAPLADMANRTTDAQVRDAALRALGKINPDW